ncbi:MAG: hypothetical protein J2P25_22655, partial [Nocardiopsaceae bacterium]|nr:hypothetical protein [Nocardiopsaceae bacterium]
QHAADVAGRRWDERAASDGTGPLIWRTQPPDPGTGGQGAGSVTSDGTAPIHLAKIPPGNGPAARGGTGPDAPGAPGTTPNAPAGARPQRKHMSARHRYTINLEPPTTDGEFLDSCVHLGDVLKSLAEQVSEWAEGLGGLNLPKSVLSPLDQLSEGLTEAASGAAQAAKAFEDEFEDARDVASRGMHITGQDAA